MKVLIQHQIDLLYRDREGKWVGDPTQAHDFLSTFEACEYAHAHRLKDVHIVLSFPKPAYNITLPLKSTPEIRRTK